MDRLKILITGISGFIGRSLAEEIINRNLPWDISGIDIKPPMFNDCKYLKDIDFETVDIRDEISVRQYFNAKKFDGIIHLAAVSRVIDGEKNKQNCIATNFKGTKYIAEAAAMSDCWMIFGSSREVYGEQSVLPVAETAELLPMNVYGFYKLEGERIVQSTVTNHCILRFSNVYGNNYDIPTRVIPAFVRAAVDGGTIHLEGGEQIIDFTYIDDTVSAIIRCVQCLDTKEFTTEIIHVLPGVANRITDIIDILREFGYHFTVDVRPPRCYDVQKFVGDPSHLRKVLGEINFTDLRTGIMKTLKNIIARPTN
jgi:nucleoside-diphosphate-sugar epimerase